MTEAEGSEGMGMKSCSAPECDRPVMAKALCVVHYWRQRRGPNKADRIAALEAERAEWQVWRSALDDEATRGLQERIAELEADNAAWLAWCKSIRDSDAPALTLRARALAQSHGNHPGAALLERLAKLERVSADAADYIWSAPSTTAECYLALYSALKEVSDG